MVVFLSVDSRGAAAHGNAGKKRIKKAYYVLKTRRKTGGFTKSDGTTASSIDCYNFC